MNLHELDTVEFQGMSFLLPDAEKDCIVLEEAMHSILNYEGGLDLVIDIGANVGGVSLMAAKKGAKRVIAYEASPLNFECLCENIRVNGFSDIITPYNLAVASVTGEKRKMYALNKCSGSHSFYGSSSKLLADIETIGFKDILRPYKKIDYLKIDVEGAEFEFIEPDDEIKELLKRVIFLDYETHPGWVTKASPELASRIKWNIGTHNEDLINFIKSCGFPDYYGGYRK